MSISQYLYQMMIRVNDSQARTPSLTDTPIADLNAAVSAVAQAIEKSMGPDAIRERALDLGCITLRIATEIAKK